MLGLVFVQASPFSCALDRDPAYGEVAEVNRAGEQSTAISRRSLAHAVQSRRSDGYLHAV